MINKINVAIRDTIAQKLIEPITAIQISSTISIQKLKVVNTIFGPDCIIHIRPVNITKDVSYVYNSVVNIVHENVIVYYGTYKDFTINSILDMLNDA